MTFPVKPTDRSMTKQIADDLTGMGFTPKDLQEQKEAMAKATEDKQVEYDELFDTVIEPKTEVEQKLDDEIKKIKTKTDELSSEIRPYTPPLKLEEPTPVLSEEMKKLANSKPTQPGMYVKARDTVINLPNTVKNALSNMFKIEVRMPEVKEVSKQAQDLMTQVSLHLKSFDKQLSNLLREATTKSNATHIIERIESILALLVTVVALWRAPSAEIRFYIVTIYVTANKLVSTFNHVFFERLISGFQTFYAKKDDVVHNLMAQAKTEKPELDENIFTMFTKLMCHSVGLGDVDFKLDEKRAAKLGKLGSAVKGTEGMVLMVYHMMKYSFQSMYEYFHGYPWGLRNEEELKKTMEEIVAYHQKVRKMDVKEIVDTREFVELYKILVKLETIEKCLTHKDVHVRALPFYTAIHELKTLAEQVRGTLKRGAPRARPVWIHIVGAPGIGKTGLRYMLAAAMTQAIDEKEMEPSHIFDRNNQSEYWEGYANQLIVVYDDLFQDVSNAEKMTSTAIEFIAMMNDTPYPLNMASLSKGSNPGKGDVYFTSKIVITTGNKEQWDVLKMADKRAIKRRIDFVVEASCIMKPTDDMKPDPENYKLKLRPHDWFDKAFKSEDIVFDELVLKVCDLYKKRNKKQVDLVAMATGIGLKFKGLAKLDATPALVKAQMMTDNDDEHEDDLEPEMWDLATEKTLEEFDKGPMDHSWDYTNEEWIELEKLYCTTIEITDDDLLDDEKHPVIPSLLAIKDWVMEVSPCELYTCHDPEDEDDNPLTYYSELTQGLRQRWMRSYRITKTRAALALKVSILQNPMWKRIQELVKGHALDKIHAAIWETERTFPRRAQLIREIRNVCAFIELNVAQRMTIGAFSPLSLIGPRIIPVYPDRWPGQTPEETKKMTDIGERIANEGLKAEHVKEVNDILMHLRAVRKLNKKTILAPITETRAECSGCDIMNCTRRFEKPKTQFIELVNGMRIAICTLCALDCIKTHQQWDGKLYKDIERLHFRGKDFWNKRGTMPTSLKEITLLVDPYGSHTGINHMYNRWRTAQHSSYGYTYTFSMAWLHVMETCNRVKQNRESECCCVPGFGPPPVRAQMMTILKKPKDWWYGPTAPETVEKHTHPWTLMTSDCKKCVNNYTDAHYNDYSPKIQEFFLKGKKPMTGVEVIIDADIEQFSIKDISGKDQTIHAIAWALKAVGIAIGALGLLFTGYKLWGSLIQDEPEVEIEKLKLRIAELEQRKKEQTTTLEETMAHNRYENKNVRIRTKAKEVRLKARQLKKTHGQSSIKPMEDVAASILPNIGLVYITLDDGTKYSQHIIFLGGTVAWTTAHFTQWVDGLDFRELALKMPGREIMVFKRKDFEILFEEGYDSSYLSFDVRILGGQFKSIIKYFPETEQTIEDMIRQPVAFMSVKDHVATMCVSTNVTPMGLCAYPLHVKKGTILEYTSDGLIEIEGDTIQPQDGDCALPYLSATQNTKQKILGLHVAGGVNRGYCLVMLQKDLQAAVDQLTHPASSVVKANMAIILPDNLKEGARSVPKDKQVRLPFRTELRRTLLEDNPIAEPIRKPAALQKKNGVSPVEKALAKGFKPDIVLTEKEDQLFNDIYRAVFDYCYKGMQNYRVYTLEQALNKPEFLDHMKGIYRNTAAGYGEHAWAANPETKGKKKAPFFTEEKLANGELRRKPTQLLIDVVEETFDKLLRDIYELIVQDVPKDELRLNEKVEAMKTRIFNPLPVEILCIMRMMFSPYVNHSMDTHNSGWFAMGINPHSAEWKKMHDYLTDNGSEYKTKNVAGGDVSGLDRNTDKKFCEQFNVNMTRDRGERDKQGDFEWSPGKFLTKEQRDTICHNLLKRVFGDRWHLVGEWMYHVWKGNPSGNFLTTVFNCLTLGVCIVFSFYFYVVSVLRVYLTITEIIRLLRLKLFGDDNLVTWPEEYDGFGLGALAIGFAKLGLEYTDWKKGAVVWINKEKMLAERNTESIYEVEFLKRSFRKTKYAIYAPTNWDLIVDMTNWCTDKETLTLGTYKSCFAALCEAYHHGKEKFEWLRHEINVRFVELGLKPLNVKFQYIFAHFHGYRTHSKLDLPFDDRMYLDIFFAKQEYGGETSFKAQMRAERMKLKISARAQMKREQEEKSKQGVLSNTLNSLSKIAAVCKSVPIVGEIASQASPIFDFAYEIAKGLGYDYPRSIAATERIIWQQQGPMALIRGLDTSESLACDPQNQVSNEQSFFVEKGGPSSSLAVYTQRPGLQNVLSFDGSNTAGEVLAKIPINPVFMQETIDDNIFSLNCLANAAMNFRYWRGSMKYMLQFTTSKFVSSRVRIEWLPDPTLDADVSDSSAGDIVSLTVDICGDTDVPFTVPYLKDTPFLVVCAPHKLKAASVADWQDVCNGALVIRVVNPPVVSVSAADATIDVAVWQAAGEDMQLGRPTNIWDEYSYSTDGALPPLLKKAEITTPQAEEKECSPKQEIEKADPNNNNRPVKKLIGRVRAQMSVVGASMQERFKTVFPPLAPSKFSAQKNILMGETVQSWTELMHRYRFVDLQSFASALAISFTIDPWFCTSFSNNYYNTWQRFQNSFGFHRGNVRIKAFIADNNTACNVHISNAVVTPLNTPEGIQHVDTSDRGMTYNDTAFRKSNEAEIPFYGIYPFVCQQYVGEAFELPVFQIDVHNYASVSHEIQTYLATGDNYSCGVPFPPGYLAYQPVSKKIKALTGVKAQMETGHGNEERRTVETSIQENTQLSGFRDQVGVKTDDHDRTTDVHKDSDPYADQGLTQVLSRKYIVQQITWTSASTYGAKIGEGDSPRELLNVDKLAETVNRFKYFRAQTEIELRLNSTTYHSGKLLICYAPHWNDGNVPYIASTNDMWSLCCFDNITLSACANETVRFSIPYVAPSAYFDLQNNPASAQYKGFFGAYKIFVLAPLRLVGAASASLTLTVYASFVRPEVAGFIPKDTVLERRLLRTVNAKFNDKKN